VEDKAEAVAMTSKQLIRQVGCLVNLWRLPSSSMLDPPALAVDVFTTTKVIQVSG